MQENDKSSKVTIKNWSEDDRPREKMLQKGRQSLSDSELLAILIGSGTPGESAVDLCKKILRDYNNNLHELGKADIATLIKRYKGIGEAKAITLLAALELGRRRQDTDPADKPQIKASSDAYKILAAILNDLPHEEFWVLLLNKANKVIHKQPISSGGIAQTVVESSIIIRLALEHYATGIILSHNHPSGAIKPSNADINVTQKLKNAAALFDITIFDHIIIGEKAYFSFADEGIL
ncbi:MAG: DNA repair protein RadC [Saprospiraceae bacterium]|nr:DNA repair protein RadC [Saprospiraceae bacterium]